MRLLAAHLFRGPWRCARAVCHYFWWIKFWQKLR
jgi:hypothetical protein